MRQIIVMSLVINRFGQYADTCPSSVMSGIGLGPPVDSVQNEVATWGKCRDLCCKSSSCITWTFLLDEQNCVLRNQLGKHVLKDKNQISGVTKSYILPAPLRSDGPLFYIGVASAPRFWARRYVSRKLCFSRLQRLDIERHQLKHEFVIGRPHGPPTPPGKHHSFVNSTKAAHTKLWKEQQEHGDITFLPERDTYFDMSAKSLEMLRIGVMHGARYIILLHDNFCPDMDRIKKLLEAKNHPQYAYIGENIWHEPLFEWQKGVDGKFVKYIGRTGICVLTFALAKLITFADFNYASMYPMYGADSKNEDVNLGRWVKHAEDKHNIKVQYIVADEDLTQELTFSLPSPPSEFDAKNRSCPSSVMPGIGLGSISTNMPQQNVTTWEECRDLCCEKDNMCVAWTLSLAEKTCFLRGKLGEIVKQDKNLISGITKSHVLPAPRRNEELQFYVGILSAPNNDAKRNIIRQKCIPKWQQLDLDEAQLKYQFVVGRPHGQQRFITKNAAAIAEKLWKEQQEYGDMAFLPAGDNYVDLPGKVLEMFKIGVMHGAHYIVKLDDDFCADIKTIRKAIIEAKDPKYAYIGNELKLGPPARNQRGMDGKFFKYYGGYTYVLTFSLARLITFADIQHSSMYPMYGSSSEDVDMGRWVKYAETKHNITAQWIHAVTAFKEKDWNYLDLT